MATLDYHTPPPPQSRKPARQTSPWIWIPVTLALFTYCLWHLTRSPSPTPLGDWIGLLFSGFCLFVYLSLVFPPFTPKGMARRRLARAKAAFASCPQWKQVELPPGFEPNFFADTMAVLQAHEFRPLGFFVNLNLPKLRLHVRGVTQFLIDRPGYIAATAIQARFVGFKTRLLLLLFRKPRRQQFISFLSEMSDGGVISTQMAATSLSNPPQVHQFIHSPATSPVALLAEHRRHIADVLAENPGTTLVAHHGTEDLFALLERIRIQKLEYLKRIGYIRAEDMARAYKRPLTDLELKIVQEIRKLCPPEPPPLPENPAD